MNQIKKSKQQKFVFLSALFLLFSGLIFLSCQPKIEVKEEITEGIVHPEWTKNANIYEVNLRQYTPEGTIKAFETHLPRLKEMGVDILWLMPIHPVGEKNRKGELGSYYSVQDYLAVNPEFGTMDEFKGLVKKAHELGMYVILDWVANHTAWDNPMIEAHPDWYAQDSAGNLLSPYDWTDVVQLNFDNQELREYMKNALVFWVKETDIDGYRCDVAGMVPTDFWDYARTELDKTKPVFMLAEAEQPDHHLKAFDMSYAWELHHIMNKIAQGEKNANDIFIYLNKNDSLYPTDAFRMCFTSNHDENSWNGTEYERMGDAAETFAALCYVVPGMPLIYSGQETALDKRLRFFEKDTINWDNVELGDFYAALGTLKKNNPALWNGNFGGNWEQIKTQNDEDIFAIMRHKEDNMVLGIFNLSDQVQELNFMDAGIDGSFTDFASGEEIKLDESTVFDLQPWAYLIFSK
jgi:cyclomaltodextrinase / maltogenic alpha-amylase / neopullulanase